MRIEIQIIINVECCAAISLTRSFRVLIDFQNKSFDHSSMLRLLSSSFPCIDESSMKETSVRYNGAVTKVRILLTREEVCPHRVRAKRERQKKRKRSARLSYHRRQPPTIKTRRMRKPSATRVSSPPKAASVNIMTVHNKT